MAWACCTGVLGWVDVLVDAFEDRAVVAFDLRRFVEAVERRVGFFVVLVDLRPPGLLLVAMSVVLSRLKVRC
jgi:hypothetical protein